MIDLPVEYKQGYKYFLGNKIDLSLKPLIPREETEYWVSLVLKEIKEGSRCLDLFSGSGCIGLSILKAIKNSYCDFGEIEDKFIQQIKINLKGIDEDRYNVIKTDIFLNIKDKYDYILANPPYVAEKRMTEVGEDVLKYEPHIALFSGENGMNIIEKLIDEGLKHLNKNGLLVIEHDEKQKEQIEKLVLKNSYLQYEFCKDQFNKYRFIKVYA